MNIVLNLTDACNLRCKYCYFNGNGRTENMSDETMEKAIAFFMNLAQDFKDKRFNITFFGGEPTLRMDLMKKAVAFAKTFEREDFEVRFAVNTNGTLLSDEILDFFEDENFEIFLSIDGKKKTHDFNRVTIDGKGCFDQIEPFLPRLISLGAMSEKVISPETAADTAEAVRYFIDLGFRRIVLSPSFESAWTRESFEVLKQEYKKLAQIYFKAQKRGKNLYISTIEDKIKIYLAEKDFKSTICNIANKVYAVGPSGKIFPCTHFVSTVDNHYVIGHVDSGFDKKKLMEVRNFLKHDKEECVDCTIKDRCIGNQCGCTSYTTTGSLEGISPFVCEHERMLCRVADEVGEKLFK